MADPIPAEGLDVEDDVRGHRWLNWEAYRKRSDRRIAMYHGQYLAQLQAYVRARVRPETWTIFRRYYAWNRVDNVMRSVILRTGTVYSRPAWRAVLPVLPVGPGEVEQSDPDPDPAYAAAIRGTGIDTILGQALHYTIACGLALVRVWVAGGRDLRYQVLAPDDFDPIVAWKDPTRLVGLRQRIAWGQDTSKPSTRTILWDMEGCAIASMMLGPRMPALRTDDDREAIAAEYAGWIELDQTGQVAAQEIGSEYTYRDADGAPVLPFAVMRTPPPPGLLCNTSEGRDLQDATLQSGRLSVELYSLLSMQAHRQVWITGHGADKIPDQALTPYSPVILPKAEGGEVQIGTLDLQSSPDGHMRAMDRILETVLLARGWNVNDFKRTANIQSADALIIEDEGKREYRASLETICRETERQLAEATVAVWNADAQGQPRMPDRHDFLVNFADPGRINILQDRELASWLLDTGLESIPGLMLAVQPDLGSREAALRQATLNRDENRKLRARGLFGNAAAAASSQPAPNPPPPTQETP